MNIHELQRYDVTNGDGESTWEEPEKNGDYVRWEDLEKLANRPPEPNPLLEQLLDGLRGPRDEFRKTLQDKDKLLQQMCSYAEYMSSKRGVAPWSVIGEITSHGSGVSSAIYELYRRRDNAAATI